MTSIRSGFGGLVAVVVVLVCGDVAQAQYARRGGVGVHSVPTVRPTPFVQPLVQSRPSYPFGTFGSPMFAPSFGSPSFSPNFGTPMFTPSFGSPMFTPSFGSPSFGPFR